MRFVYLATPYSKYPKGIEAAWVDACALAGELIKAGIPTYSPIAHTHPIAVHAKIDPYAHSIWIPLDETIMEAAAGIVVAQMPSWETSYGIRHERDWFKARERPEFKISAVPTESEIGVLQQFVRGWVE